MNIFNLATENTALDIIPSLIQSIKRLDLSLHRMKSRNLNAQYEATVDLKRIMYSPASTSYISLAKQAAAAI